MSIRVVIAEDQSMVLGALAALLEIEDDISVVGQAHDGREALKLTLQHKPDLLLTDIEMPEMTGLELAAELKRQGAAAELRANPAHPKRHPSGFDGRTRFRPGRNARISLRHTARIIFV